MLSLASLVYMSIDIFDILFSASFARRTQISVTRHCERFFILGFSRVSD